MSLLFDASSIYAALELNRPEILHGQYTLDLAFYELGNIVWKGYALYNRLTKRETLQLIEMIIDALKLMNILSIKFTYERNILEIAMKYKITYYDASYVSIAKENKLKLVSEDKKLKKSIKNFVATLSAREV